MLEVQTQPSFSQQHIFGYPFLVIYQLRLASIFFSTYRVRMEATTFWLNSIGWGYCNGIFFYSSYNGIIMGYMFIFEKANSNIDLHIISAHISNLPVRTEK